MEVQEAIDYIGFVIEQVQEDLIYQRWINGYQTEIDFDMFKAGLISKTRPPMSTDEIMAQTKDILDSMARDEKWKSLNYSEQYS